MPASLLLAILAIAALDSLNPSLFLAEFFLLTTARPVLRTLSYICGVVLTNFLGGLLLLGGVRGLVSAWMISLSNETVLAAQLGLGVLFLGFGLLYRPGAQGAAVRKPRSPHLFHAFALGALVMINELTTALPYFVAVERIAQAKMVPGWNLVALVFYNVVFSLPLFGFMLAYIALRERFAGYVEKISHGIQLWLPRILRGASVVVGIGLSANSLIGYAVGNGTG